MEFSFAKELPFDDDLLKGAKMVELINHDTRVYVRTKFRENVANKQGWIKEFKMAQSLDHPSISFVR